MKVKTFSGTSLPEAIVKAKKEFGNNIILLESKEIPASRTKTGSKLVQVTVSIDGAGAVAGEPTVKAWTPPRISTNPETVKKQYAAPEVETKPQAPKKVGNDFNKVIQDILARKPKELNQEQAILSELAALKEQISQISLGQTQAQPESLPGFYDQVLNELVEKGFQDKYAKALMKRVYQLAEHGADAGKQEIIDAARTELRQRFIPYNHKRSGPRKKSRVILMVGATGVGKTTSAMKLAAHQQMFGKKEVAIISTDLYGPGEALKAFSKMNGTNILEKKRVDELEKLVPAMDEDVIIIDTPGQSPFAPNYLKKLEEYVKAVKPSDIFLVLPLNTDIKDLYLSSALYMLLKPTGIILTKVDETAQPGKAFSIVEELHLPVVAFADGKRIFIDAHMPEADYLLEKIFDEQRGLS